MPIHRPGIVDEENLLGLRGAVLDVLVKMAQRLPVKVRQLPSDQSTCKHVQVGSDTIGGVLAVALVSTWRSTPGLCVAPYQRRTAKRGQLVLVSPRDLLRLRSAVPGDRLDALDFGWMLVSPASERPGDLGDRPAESALRSARRLPDSSLAVRRPFAECRRAAGGCEPDLLARAIAGAGSSSRPWPAEPTRGGNSGLAPAPGADARPTQTRLLVAMNARHRWYPGGAASSSRGGRPPGTSARWQP